MVYLNITLWSTLIQRAVHCYIGVKEQKEKNAFLKENYLALTGETKIIMEDFKYADQEVLKHIN